LEKGKNALIYGGVRAACAAVPIALATGHLSAALNSSTYPESLDTATRDYARIENFNSFDSNESNEDRLNKQIVRRPSAHF